MPADHGRRQFLCGAAAYAALGSMPVLAADVRSLCLHHMHTGEKLDVTYFEGGDYLPDALREIDHLLRDHRSGDVCSMDTGLLDLLHAVRGRCGRDGPFEVISGYRSPATNEMLRRNSTGVAKRSLHMQGRAIDVRIPGLDTAELRRAAMKLSAGGVGYYPKSGFVHLDTGRVRAW